MKSMLIVSHLVFETKGDAVCQRAGVKLVFYPHAQVAGANILTNIS